jgi:hypothetical protein
MNKLRLAFVLLAWLGLAGHPARAAQLVALAPEEELYSDVFSNPPSVAAQPGGPYVIAWDDDTFSYQEGSFSYRYTAAGADTANGDYRTLYSPTGIPSVSSVTAGRQGFDVIWRGFQTRGPSLFYRAHLNLQGVREGKQVHMGGPGTEWIWQVRGSGFMAGWPLPSKHGIAARRLTDSGQRTGPELRLNSRLVDHPLDVSVVGLADASFVAVWLAAMPGSPGTAVLRARRFSPSGQPLEPDFDINTVPLGVLDTISQDGPRLKVAAAPGGGFVVAWSADQGAYLRWFNAAGLPLGPERIVSEPGDSLTLPQSLAFDDAGTLLLLLGVDYFAIQAQLFDPQGKPVGTPVDVNDDETEHPWGGDAAWAGDSWIVTWVAAIFPYDQSSIFVRRFAKR